MNKLEWCKEKDKGIKIVEPNSNLAEKYIEKAEESLLTMEATTSQEWKITAAYYTCYNSIYALLQKTGIKSEIHSCTLELMKFYKFTESEKGYVKELKEDRINAQYHVTKELELKSPSKVKDFLLKCKKMLEETDFQEKRKKITKALK
ncbi:MAG: hypothetical protein ACOCTT_02165 [archaeon]